MVASTFSLIFTTAQVRQIKEMESAMVVKSPIFPLLNYYRPPAGSLYSLRINSEANLTGCLGCRCLKFCLTILTMGLALGIDSSSFGTEGGISTGILRYGKLLNGYGVGGNFGS